MTIIEALFYVAIIAFLVYGWIRLRTSQPFEAWTGRVMLLLALLLVAKIVDTYLIPMSAPLPGRVHEQTPSSSPGRTCPPAPTTRSARSTHHRRTGEAATTWRCRSTSPATKTMVACSQRSGTTVALTQEAGTAATDPTQACFGSRFRIGSGYGSTDPRSSLEYGTASARRNNNRAGEDLARRQKAHGQDERDVGVHRTTGSDRRQHVRDDSPHADRRRRHPSWRCDGVRAGCRHRATERA